ncbi:hypothetical protein Ancab_005689 [Ancistrocladus abbreviatus]
MRFELRSGGTKCITEDLKHEAMTVGKYTVVNPNESRPLPSSHRLTVRVTSPHGNNYHYGDVVESGNFAFTAPESGDYMVCFWAPYSNPPVTLTVEFEWKTGVDARDWSSIARKGQIDSSIYMGVSDYENKGSRWVYQDYHVSGIMEVELKRLYETVKYIHDEMFYLREREEEMQRLNRATNSKMAVFSFLSIMVCLSVAGLQLWHLKSFFERKKLL